MPSGDHLKLAGDKKALKALASNSAGNDTVLWSLKVTKINKKGCLLYTSPSPRDR